MRRKKELETKLAHLPSQMDHIYVILSKRNSILIFYFIKIYIFFFYFFRIFSLIYILHIFYIFLIQIIYLSIMVDEYFSPLLPPPCLGIFCFPDFIVNLCLLLTRLLLDYILVLVLLIPLTYFFLVFFMCRLPDLFNCVMIYP